MLFFFFLAKCLEFARSLHYSVSPHQFNGCVLGGLGVVLAPPFPHTRGLTGGSEERRHIWVCLTGRRQGLGARASADGRQGAREAGTWASALPRSQDKAAAGRGCHGAGLKRGRGCRGGGASEGLLTPPSFHSSAMAVNF